MQAAAADLRTSIPQAQRKRIMAAADYLAVAPDVVLADAGWWYPGESSLDESLRSSVNHLTSNDRSDVQMGSATMRGLAVGIRRVGPGRG